MGKTDKTLNGFPVEKRRLDELVKALWNPRKISEKQKDSLKRSLKEFGNVEPVVWNKQTGHIVGGHQRVDALIDCGETETDIVVVDMSEEREQALNIALNKISGDWDTDKLAKIFEELDGHIDTTLTGFSEKEIASMILIPDLWEDDGEENFFGRKVKCPECGHEFTLGVV